MLNKSKSPRNDSRQAFTLVELLVVIGIIALLISILLPVLNKAKGRAYDVQCKANLRQIAMTMFMYAGDNKNHLPNYCYSTGPGPSPTIVYYDPIGTDTFNPSAGLWSECLHKYLYNSARRPAAGPGSNYYLGGTFMRCPSAPPYNGNDFFWTYGVNFGPVGTTQKPGIFNYYSLTGEYANHNGSRRLTAVKPTEFLVCDVIRAYSATPPYAYNNKYQTPDTDTDGDGLLDTYSGTYNTNKPYGRYNYVDFRHEQQMNYATADGAVQSARAKEWFAAKNPAWYVQ